MRKPNGCHRAPFTREIWDRWLARLNAAPDPRLTKGIAEMRALLQTRCIGTMHESIENTGRYRRFVEEQFGVVSECGLTEKGA